MGSLLPPLKDKISCHCHFTTSTVKGHHSVIAIFYAFGSVCGRAPDSNDLKEASEIFDMGRDGKISVEELLRFFKAIKDELRTLEECWRMIKGVDKNRDGFVCFEEFSRMMELQRRL